MIRKPFVLKLYDAATMQRWNDKIRTVEFTELDKQAHKMIIAFLFAKLEETKGNKIDWIRIIEGGLFEFLQRLVVTDLKPQLLDAIKKNPEDYRRLNEWALGELEPIVSPIGPDFYERFKKYLLSNTEDINTLILGAAHFWATAWEVDILEAANKRDDEFKAIKTHIEQEKVNFYEKLEGTRDLTLYEKYQKFVDLCGLLRFQIRWSQAYRIPRTSVLGHMLIVAMLSYLVSVEAGCCETRKVNNYFTGLFHDLPEVLTRDVVTPVKTSIEGLDALIKDYEMKEMETRLFPLLPKEFAAGIKVFTEDEFSDIAFTEGEYHICEFEKICEDYNDDRYNARDGSIVKAADDLAAFVEAYLAVRNGIRNEVFDEAKSKIREKYEGRPLHGVRLNDLYADFD